MSKHTPGPWDIINQYIIAADESVICQWESYTDEANARLIAAAPDLLAACKQLVNLTHDYDPKTLLANDDATRMRWIEAWRAIREAVRKAEGAS